MRVALLLAGAIFAAAAAAAPGQAQPLAADSQIARDDDQPHGERWEDRWRGRKHILYDEYWQDGTDGEASALRSDCRSYAVRYKRADGTTAVRRDNRCD